MFLQKMFPCFGLQCSESKKPGLVMADDKLYGVVAEVANAVEEKDGVFCCGHLVVKQWTGREGFWYVMVFLVVLCFSDGGGRMASADL